MKTRREGRIVTCHTDDIHKYGVNAAMLLAYFDFWTEKNSDRGYNQTVYTYQTFSGLDETFSFMSRSTIQRALRVLVKKKAIIIEVKVNKKVRGNRSMYITQTEERQNEIKHRSV